MVVYNDGKSYGLIWVSYLLIWEFIFDFLLRNEFLIVSIEIYSEKDFIYLKVFVKLLFIEGCIWGEWEGIIYRKVKYIL